MIRIDNLKIYKDLSEEELFAYALKKNKIKKQDVLEMNIFKKSIDARNKKDVHYNYAINVTLKDETKYPKAKKITPKPLPVIQCNRKSKLSPVIVGAGPAGLFCALFLIDHGYKPIIIEQGDCVENRQKYVEEYRTTGHLNEMCNVQFGEGGAGTFSDGKLTSNVTSYYVSSVLEYFYHFGAPKEILYTNKPHIGTDNLVTILKNIRAYIEEKGGKYYFNTKFIDYKKHNDQIEVICDHQSFVTDALVLAIGHSARDTFKMLKDKNIEMVRKTFSVGVRCEHKQTMIDRSQYGTFTTLQLPPAEYKLAYHGKNNRSCYTFCMCPGGEVIASSSEQNGIVTNGMSVYKRDKENANSALLVNVYPEDLQGDDPLEGMYYQARLEQKAYILGGSNGNAPIQRVEDFLNNQPSTKIGKIKPSYKPGVTLCNLHDILPDYIGKTLQEGIIDFDKKVRGFADPDAILTGVETRSSSPITILRDDSLMCNEKGIYPCGEGPGHAGGITSAACDGIKVAIKIIEKNDD